MSIAAHNMLEHLPTRAVSRLEPLNRSTPVLALFPCLLLAVAVSVLAAAILLAPELGQHEPASVEALAGAPPFAFAGGTLAIATLLCAALCCWRPKTKP